MGLLREVDIITKKDKILDSILGFVLYDTKKGASELSLCGELAPFLYAKKELESNGNRVGEHKINLNILDADKKRGVYRLNVRIGDLQHA